MTIPNEYALVNLGRFFDFDMGTSETSDRIHYRNMIMRVPMRCTHVEEGPGVRRFGDTADMPNLRCLTERELGACVRKIDRRPAAAPATVQLAAGPRCYCVGRAPARQKAPSSGVPGTRYSAATTVQQERLVHRLRMFHEAATARVTALREQVAVAEGFAESLAGHLDARRRPTRITATRSLRAPTSGAVADTCPSAPGPRIEASLRRRAAASTGVGSALQGIARSPSRRLRQVSARDGPVNRATPASRRSADRPARRQALLTDVPTCARTSS